MIGPSIDPTEVGFTGLLWLFLTYGYVLYQGANFISEGSELLLLVPSMAGLVGGVVLPLLGAVPDGAIILFSGLGSLEDAQETLSVGVGALAGSTIMLLTVPWFLSIMGGRVNYEASYGGGGDHRRKPNYMGKPKLTQQDNFIAELTETGISISDPIKHGGVIMIYTTLPYFLIQVPALFLHGPKEKVAAGEHWWSLTALSICLIGLALYIKLQLKISRDDDDRGKRMAVIKKQLQNGAISLSGAVAAKVNSLEAKAAREFQLANLMNEITPLNDMAGSNGGNNNDHLNPPPAVADYLKEILSDSFRTYDADRNGQLDRNEVYVFFRDFHEAITEDECDSLFKKFDKDNSNTIDLDEFIGVAYLLIKLQDDKSVKPVVERSEQGRIAMRNSLSLSQTAFAAEEEEEIPEELCDLTPDQQQAAIKKKAFLMLALGSLLVLIFSDPMVDVLAAIASRVRVSPFYVSFVLAPLASNASELIASQYYASKKTRKTITVSLSALEGAACMNNTFCLSIFMGLIFFRGLAWQYTAETIAILACEFLVGILVQADAMSLGTGLFILALFPLSIGLVALLEYMGFD